MFSKELQFKFNKNPILLISEPGVGKTTLLLSLAIMSERQGSVLFISFHETVIELQNRIEKLAGAFPFTKKIILTDMNELANLSNPLDDVIYLVQGNEMEYGIMIPEEFLNDISQKKIASVYIDGLNNHKFAVQKGMMKVFQSRLMYLSQKLNTGIVCSVPIQGIINNIRPEQLNIRLHDSNFVMYDFRIWALYRSSYYLIPDEINLLVDYSSYFTTTRPFIVEKCTGRFVFKETDNTIRLITY